MLAFVTVGSTRFDPLIHAVLEASVLDALRLRGYSTLVVQCGNSDLTPCGLPTAAASDSWKLQRSGVNVEIWKFKPTLETEFRRADLVISHAGSGTILDVLRMNSGGKPKAMIVVPNPTLLDNHQQELAVALGDMHYLFPSTVDELPRTIQAFDSSTLTPFPAFDGSRFRDLLDQEMGFI